ncbi:MAG: hypothetical protein ACRCV0_04125, partial [Brevinema sp.]
VELQWILDTNASTYEVYKATLENKLAQIKYIKNKDFHKISTLSTNFTTISNLNQLPRRRYVFLVKAYDKKNNLIQEFISPEVYTYPRNPTEFLQEIDFTIAHAQQQIPNFGLAGSSDTIKGAVQGEYEYAANLFHPKSNWNNYASFETILSGVPDMHPSVIPPGVIMDGSIKISGLFEGALIYHNLVGLSQGLTGGGTIEVQYQHPTKGIMKQTYTHTDSAKFLISVVTKISKKKKISLPKKGGGLVCTNNN